MVHVPSAGVTTRVIGPLTIGLGVALVLGPPVGAAAAEPFEAPAEKGIDKSIDSLCAPVATRGLLEAAGASKDSGGAEQAGLMVRGQGATSRNPKRQRDAAEVTLESGASAGDA